ncbi:phorbol-12-myristate-13-acetate-induced protein 1 [Betta splendens]|uniref:Phorbol-12-myristate-13-acetate-induced protein 1 n=1 Tax=Betta splendens TaxID=158456 RepID=A0A8M1HM02_BETSP|nr:phorbol-12-myristate-13-acetate-induced protein 1 [Betta splendens]
MASCDFTAAIDLCARELREIGDGVYWKYKLLEILIKNYKTVIKSRET